MPAFYLKYRKALTALSIILFLFLPLNIYRSITILNTNGHTGQAVGTFISGLITFLLAPAYLLVNISAAKKKPKEETAV